MLKRFAANLRRILAAPNEYCTKCGYPRAPRTVCVHCLEQAKERAYERKKLKEQTLVLVEKLGGWRPYEEYLVERFRPSSVTQSALAACLRWDISNENIYLWSSGAGTGKSHLAVVAARSHLERFVPGRVVKPNELFREVRSTYDKDSKESDTDVINQIVRLPILVIDDLGAQKDTEWNCQCLYDLIEGRYSHQPGGLIVTANLSMAEAGARWGTRINSRLAQLCGNLVFCLNGEPDHRRIRA